MKRKKGKRKNHGNAILLVVILLLAAVAVILGWKAFELERNGSVREQQISSDFSQTESKTGTVTERTEGFETEQQSEMQTQTETEMKLQTEAQTEEQTEDEAIQKLTVAIDPGHQGSWIDMSEKEPIGPGASEQKDKATVGTEGRFSQKAEYELNLEVSLLLRDELKARGYEVIMTREDHDTAISNAQRAQMASEMGGDIYVRIHANGSDDPSLKGALAMVPSRDNPYVSALAEDSYLLADCILRAYCETAQFESLGIQYYDNMSGINWSSIPVMILEMGYMTNESDDLRMADTQVQHQMAVGIADGIDAYFEAKGRTQSEEERVDNTKITQLLQELETSLIAPAAANGEKWAVSMADLKTGAEGSINGTMPMKSASVIKVFIMAAIYDRVCYPSDPERYIPIPESYEGELRQLIEAMITVSDNEASNQLLTALGQGDAQAGMAVVNQFCEENGYAGTRVGRKFLEANPTGDNYTSADDCCRLLRSIYEGTCVNAEASAKMLAFLKAQTRTGKIPAAVAGTSAVTANKTGELYGEYGDVVENDIAIIEDETSAYVLCVLSGQLNDNSQGVNRITDISRMVYENR